MSDLPLLDPVLEDEQPAAERPSHRRRWIALAVIVAVLIVVVAVFGALDWRRLHTGSSLDAPATIGTLRHDTAADASQTADYLREALGADISLDSTLGAVYSDPVNNDRIVLFFGGTGRVDSPDEELSHALGLLNDDSGSVTGLHDVSPGPLGGTMRCGTSNRDGGAMSVCGWADNGSIAVALFPGRSVDESATLMLQLRTAMQHRH